MPQLKYWQTVHDTEMLLLRFVRSIRTGDLCFSTGSHQWDEIADWAFILDHYNYARWLPVHVRDTMNVRVKHSDQFADGFVTIAKTQNPFSMIGFYQNHEQQNKELKMHMVGPSIWVMSVSLPSGLWRDRKLPGSSRSLR